MSDSTKLRRLQRRHSQQCYKAGALQRVAHAYECQVFDDLLNAEEACTLLQSVAVHRADCKQLDASVHFAQTSNCLAFGNGHKSKATFKSHRLMHRTANMIKHNTKVLDPPPPPPMHVDNSGLTDELKNAKWAHLLELEMISKTPITQFVPFTGHSWNILAAPFVPRVYVEYGKYSESVLTSSVSQNGLPLQQLIASECADALYADPAEAWDDSMVFVLEQADVVRSYPADACRCDDGLPNCLYEDTDRELAGEQHESAVNEKPINNIIVYGGVANHVENNTFATNNPSTVPMNNQLFVLFSALQLVLQPCGSVVSWIRGGFINSPYFTGRWAPAKCYRYVSSVSYSLLFALAANISLLASWIIAPIGACYHAGNFVLRLALVQGYRLSPSSFALQDSQLTGNEDYDESRRTMSHQDWSSLRRDNARKRSGPPRPTIWNWHSRQIQWLSQRLGDESK